MNQIWIITCILSSAQSILARIGRWTEKHAENLSNTSLTLTLCKRVLEVSNQPIFHIVALSPSVPVGSIIQNLHDSSITTHVITHPIEVRKISGGVPKNVIFFLDGFMDILSLVLDSISGFNKEVVQSNVSMQQSSQNLSGGCSRMMKDDPQVMRLSRYCFESDWKTINWMKDVNDCDFLVRVTTAELDDGPLTDHTYSFTAGLHGHDLWNYKNHLIFVLNAKERGRNNFGPKKWVEVSSRHSTEKRIESGDLKDLRFIFKFFWRFFRGQKAVICLEERCFWRDPFADTVWQFDGLSDEPYFDFSMKNLHEKQVIFYLTPDIVIEETLRWPFWWNVVITAFVEIGTSRNCSFKPQFSIDDFYTFIPNDDSALNFSIDLILFNGGFSLNATRYSELDSSVAIETCSVSLVAPRLGFLPQYLAPFKCFSTVVWGLILITIAISWAAQFAYLRSQRIAFGRLYSEQEKYIFKDASSFFIIYEYAICGNPYHVPLGRLYVGRILFLINIFSFFIICTIFLSRMVELLSNYVRYPDIGTPSALKESDFLIQSPNSEAGYAAFFKEHSQYEGLDQKVTNGMDYWQRMLDEVYLSSSNRLVDYFHVNGTDINLSSNFTSFYSKKLHAISTNIRSIMDSDALILNIPHSSKFDKHILLTDPFTAVEKHEYNIVGESLITYPFLFRSLRHSFFFDVLCDKISQMLEAGFVQKLCGGKFNEALGLYRMPDDQEDRAKEPPRPFSMKDLQLAFIALALGLVLSFFTFIGEMIR